MNKWWVRLTFGILIWLIYYLLTIFFDYHALPILPIITVSYLLFSNQFYILPLVTASVLVDWSNFEFWPIFTITALLIWPIFKQACILIKRFDEFWIKLSAGVILNLFLMAILEFLTWRFSGQVNLFKSDFYFSWILLIAIGNLILAIVVKRYLSNQK